MVRSFRLQRENLVHTDIVCALGAGAQNLLRRVLS